MTNARLPLIVGILTLIPATHAETGLSLTGIDNAGITTKIRYRQFDYAPEPSPGDRDQMELQAGYVSVHQAHKTNLGWLLGPPIEMDSIAILSREKFQIEGSGRHRRR